MGQVSAKVELWVYQVGRDFQKENKVIYMFNLSWFNVIDFDLVNFLPIFILLFILHMSSYIALNVNKHRLNGNPLCGLIKSLSPIAILV
jgi:hypothetical protein